MTFENNHLHLNVILIFYFKLHCYGLAKIITQNDTEADYVHVFKENYVNMYLSSYSSYFYTPNISIGSKIPILLEIHCTHGLIYSYIHKLKSSSGPTRATTKLHMYRNYYS